MRRLWIGFAVVVVLSFCVLGWIGTRIYQEMPPIPARVVTLEGTEIIGEGDIGRGQNVWQSLGGMQVGSIWGHGSYVAPDWTADWLHRELMGVLEDWSMREFARPFDKLSVEDRARLQARLQSLYRSNTYDQARNVIVIDEVRARAFASVAAHYD